MSRLNVVVQRFETYFAKVLAKFKTQDSGSMHIETGPLNSNASKNIDLKPLLPEGTVIDDYHIQTVMVELLVIDPDQTSPFFGQAVPADAVMSYGITPTGILTIRNYHTAAVTYWLRVLNPALKP